MYSLVIWVSFYPGLSTELYLRVPPMREHRKRVWFSLGFAPYPTTDQLCTVLFWSRLLTWTLCPPLYFRLHNLGTNWLLHPRQGSDHLHPEYSHVSDRCR